MAHGITEMDKGVVKGTTWHGLAQYKQQETWVTFAQAQEVLNFPLEKVQLYRDGGARMLAVDAWAIIRTDTNNGKGTVLVPHVGSDFQVFNNVHLLNTVNEGLLALFPELKIESVGTLFGGATTFVNLALDTYQIKGDKSATINRLMYYNPLGRGSYGVGAHSTRIVCNNTLRAATAEASANKTLTKFRHSISAQNRINEALIDMAKVKLGLKEHFQVMEHLAKQQVVRKDVLDFLNKWMPLPADDNGKPKEGRALTMQLNKRDAFEKIMQGQCESMLQAVAFSKYGVLQAAMAILDHEEPARGNDAASIAWDGMVGMRAKRKDEALALLVA